MSKTQKKFYLSEDEKRNVVSRKSVLEEKQYEARLVENDLSNYIRLIVCGRVGVKPDQQVKLSNDSTFIEVEETKEEKKPANVKTKK